MASDEALMLDVRRGSREAFEELFARYREPVYGFFRRRISAEGRPEDLTQETFLAVLRGAKRYEPRASVRSYLFGIAFNLLSSERRSSERQKGLALEREPAAEPVSDETLWLREALAKLEERDREILMLREYEQLSYSEIAALLRMPVNTVRSRLFRSRMALKSLLVEEA
jgi:RNA polymerase sigma-70 factor (ECF subfamily)